jgi:hypothetical protein
MDVKDFAEWLRRQGHKVYETESSYWYAAGPRVFQAFPYHKLISPTEKELRKFMISKGIIALRYSTPIEMPEGMASYHIVLQNPYELEMLRSQARNGIKKGLKVFKIEQISFERLADEGWKLQEDTLDRQDRLNSMSQNEWQRMCLAATDLPGFEAWAATSNGKLAAAGITVRLFETFYVPYAASHRDYLREHVNNALFYVVSTNFLARKEISNIFFCLHSLDAPASVDQFKLRMGFTPKPVRQRVVFHPWLKPFANWRIHAFLEKLVNRYPLNTNLAKSEGMLRFYLKGLIPLAEQEWPEAIADMKENLV